MTNKYQTLLNIFKAGADRATATREKEAQKATVQKVLDLIGDRFNKDPSFKVRAHGKDLTIKSVKNGQNIQVSDNGNETFSVSLDGYLSYDKGNIQFVLSELGHFYGVFQKTVAAPASKPVPLAV
jgi:hypothetical protein